MEGSGLGIDLKLMLAQTINFLLFLFLFSKFIVPNFFKFIQKEKKEEEERIKILEDLEKQKQNQQEALNATLKDAKTQAKNIIIEAEVMSKKQREKLLNEAINEAHEIREKAKKQLETDRVGLLSEIRSHIIMTSKSLVETALKDRLGKKEQSEIILNLVKKLKDTKSV